MITFYKFCKLILFICSYWFRPQSLWNTWVSYVPMCVVWKIIIMSHQCLWDKCVIVGDIPSFDENIRQGKKGKWHIIMSDRAPHMHILVLWWHISIIHTIWEVLKGNIFFSVQWLKWYFCNNKLFLTLSLPWTKIILFNKLKYYTMGLNFCRVLFLC